MSSVPFCRYCGSTRRPFVRSRVAPAGWAVVAVLAAFFFGLGLFLCFPLFLVPLALLGLLIREEFHFCPGCGARLD